MKERYKIRRWYNSERLNTRNGRAGHGGVWRRSRNQPSALPQTVTLAATKSVFPALTTSCSSQRAGNSANMRATGPFVLLFALLQLANAVTVYLHPQPANLVVPAQLDAKRANFAISKHLNLEKFETPGENAISENDYEEGLVGSGARDGLLIAMSEEDAESTSYKHSSQRVNS